MATRRRLGGLICVAALLASCERPAPECPICETVEVTPPPEDVSPQAFDLSQIAFSDVPDWRTTPVEPSVSALTAHCERLASRDPEEALSERASYGGTVGDWLPACEILPRYIEVGELHRFFEDYFFLYAIETEEETNRLTGYYEPEIDVSTRPRGELNQPIPGRPDDLIQVDLGQFDPSLQGRRVWGRVDGQTLDLYYAREDIQRRNENALAYAHPTDVFFLQIQGSGRLRFPDGTLKRAGFSAHNHRPFGSLANHLIRTGEIARSEAGMEGIRDWMERVGVERAQEAMNVNPRYVWFGLSDISNPNEGPPGAAAIPLTPMGSMAVDLNHHPMGVPFLVRAPIPTEPGRAGDVQNLVLIAQDTGGAIQGVRRGDIFFGSGDEAGALAGSMNQPGEFFIMLPQPVERDAE